MDIRPHLLSRSIFKKRHLLHTIATFLAAFTIFPNASLQAAVLWTNPITGTITETNPSASNPYTAGQTFLTGITVSGIGRGSGVNAGNFTANDSYGGKGWQSSSLNSNDYFTFTLTPVAGKLISFTSFVYTATTFNNGPVSFAFRSSVDNFTANVGIPTGAGTTISLTGATFQNRSTATEFRLYAWDAKGGGADYSINDFTFNGTVVPEPSTYLGGSLIFALAAWSQRKRFSQLAKRTP